MSDQEWPSRSYVIEIERLNDQLAQIKESENRLAEVCDTMVRVFVNTISASGPPPTQYPNLTQWEPALEKTIRALMARPNLNDGLTAGQSAPCTHQET